MSASCLAAPAVTQVPRAKDHDDSVARQRRSADTVYLRDLAEGDDGRLFAGNLNAPAGRHRLHASMALHPLGNLTTSWLSIRLRVGAQERVFNVLAFGAADEFSDLAMDFTTPPGGGDTPVTIDWSFEGKGSSIARAKSTLVPQGPGEDVAKGNGGDAFELDDRDDRQPLARAKGIGSCLMLRDVHAEPLSPVAVERVRTGKITYKRGEQGQGTLELRNTSRTPQTVSLVTEIESGLDRKRPIRTETIDVPAGQTVPWKGDFATEALAWGCGFHVTATVAGFPAEGQCAIFSVPDHFWDVAIMATCPAQMTRDFGTMDAARQAAAGLKAQGFNGFEAYFWAPCDFLDYTPRTERFFSGQTAYCQTVTGTRNLIAACHELGIAATFYANLWGGSGEPAFEAMRSHPDWFGSANFHTGALDDASLMTAGIIRGPGHKVWSYNQINDKAGMGVFDLHVEQILGTRKMFGWDGIRYDSYYSAPWTIAAMTHIRERVGKETPEFLFGYNAFADAEDRAGAMDSLAGGMIMAEGLRVGTGSRVVDLLQGLNAWRNIGWPHRAAIGPLYGFTAGGDNKKSLPPTPLDHILMSSTLIAAGAHPYYNRMESAIGDHPGFALRYAELVYNTAMRLPRDPDSVVVLPKGIEPLAWRQLVRVASLGDGHQRLVLHLINAPETYTLGTLEMGHPAPLRNVALRFSLPQGAKVNGAWLLQAVPTAAHQPLPFTTEGQTICVTLPEIRFYGIVVLDFASATPVPESTEPGSKK